MRHLIWQRPYVATSIQLRDFLLNLVMEKFDEIDEPVLLSPSGKKRRRQHENSARALAKRPRYSGDEKIPRVSCTHKAGVCTASTLTKNDLVYIKGQLYATTDKVKQDAIPISRMAVQQCKRKRPGVEDQGRQRNRAITVKHIALKENKEKVPVCQASFLSTFWEYSQLLT